MYEKWFQPVSSSCLKIIFNSQAVALYKYLLEYKINLKITINIDARGKYLPKNCLGVKTM